MAANEEEELIGLDWKEPLYGEAFSEQTRKTGRNLLLIAVATLLISVFEVSIKTLPVFSIDFSKQPVALEMFMAAINLVLLVAYGLRVSADFLRARENWADLVRFFEARRVNDAYADARKTDAEIMSGQYDEGEWDPDPWYEIAIDIEAAAKERIAKLESKLGDRMMPRTIRHIRLWLLGGGPLAIGFIAFIHTIGPAWEFILAIIGMDS